MRPRVDWMTPADDSILEFLAEKDIDATPKVIAANIDYSRQYVNERIGPLADNDLVEPVGKGLYRATERGRDYLAGEFDASDLKSNS